MSVATSTASTDWQRWKEFVLRGRLQRVGIGSYYQTQSSDHRAGEVKVDEVDKTMRNLLQDWIGTGALTLPAGRKMDEYEFRMEEDVATNDWSVYNMVWFTDKKTGVSGVLLRGMGDFLEHRISGVGWKYMMKTMVEIMNGVGGAVPIKDADGNTVGFAS